MERFMYADYVCVEAEKLGEFIRTVSPKKAFVVEDMGEGLYTLSFSCEEDIALALQSNLLAFVPEGI